MQLFRLHRNLAANARAYPDKYTYNQIRESEQFLRYALYNELGFQYPNFPVSDSNSHLKHPLTLWAGESFENWMDAYQVTRFCHLEWQDRYDHPKTKEHKSWARLRELRGIADDLPRAERTLQPCPFDDRYKRHLDPQTLDEVIENYRNYILMDKSKKEWFKYERRDVPVWMRPYISKES